MYFLSQTLLHINMSSWLC